MRAELKTLGLMFSKRLPEPGAFEVAMNQLGGCDIPH